LVRAGCLEHDAATNRTLVCKKSMSQRLINDYHRKCRLGIRGCESTALNKRNGHRLEIMRSDRAHFSQRQLTDVQRRMAFDRDVSRIPIGSKWQIVDSADGLHTGKRTN